MKHYIVNLSNFAGYDRRLSNVVFSGINRAADEVMAALPEAYRRDFGRRIGPYVEGKVFMRLNFVLGFTLDIGLFDYANALVVDITECEVRP